MMDAMTITIMLVELLGVDMINVST